MFNIFKKHTDKNDVNSKTHMIALAGDICLTWIDNKTHIEYLVLGTSTKAMNKFLRELKKKQPDVAKQLKSKSVSELEAYSYVYDNCSVGGIMLVDDSGDISLISRERVVSRVRNNCESNKYAQSVSKDVEAKRELLAATLDMFKHVESINIYDRNEYYSLAYFIDRAYDEHGVDWTCDMGEKWLLMAWDNRTGDLTRDISVQTMTTLLLDSNIQESDKIVPGQKLEVIKRNQENGTADHFGILDKKYAPNWAIEFEPIYYRDN